ANLAEKKGSVDDRPLNFDRGKYLFGRDCVACHSIGHGDGLGPDLLGVVKIRDRQWLIRMIQQPDELLEKKDPIAVALLKKYNDGPMPNLGTRDPETGYLAGYIEAQTAGHDKGGAGDAGAAPTKPPGESGKAPQSK